MGKPRYTLIFDGECGICSRSVAWLNERDRDHRFEFIPFQEPAVPARFPQISREEFESAMQLVSPDGARWQGALAVEEILKLLPRWRILGPFFRVPGIRRLADFIYRAVARNRSRLGCGDHCAVRPPSGPI